MKLEFLKNEKFIKVIKILALISLLALIAVVIFIANYSQLLGPDDYAYSWVQGDPNNKIDSLSDCIATGKYIYNNWTGRLIPHILIGIFRNLNEYVFEIINTLVFLLFITTLSKVMPKKVTFLGVITAFGYLTFAKMFGEKFTWIAGTLNYLWPSTALAIFISIMYKYIYKDINLNTFQKIAFVLFTFVAGFFHETTTFVGGMFLICIYLLNIKELLKATKKEKAFFIITFIVFCIGAYLNIFAPGNMARVDRDKAAFSLTLLSNYYENAGLLIITLISIIIIGILKEKEMLKRELVLFIVPALVATIPMLIIGEFPERAFLPFEVMFIIVLVNNVVFLAEKFKDKQILIAVISCALVLITFLRFLPSTHAQIRYLRPYKEEIKIILETARDEGKTEILVPEFKYAQWIHAEDGINISNFFLDWRCDLPINVYTAMYYNLKNIQAIGEDEYLVKLKLTTPDDEYNSYVIYDTETGVRVREMQYFNEIEFPIKKDKIGIYKIDGTELNLQDKVESIELYSIEDGQIDSSNIMATDLIFNDPNFVETTD